MPTERPAFDRRVLLLAPTARDGSATVNVLADSNVVCTVCTTLDHLCDLAVLGAAAVIVPEEVVLSDESDRLAERLRQQPVWSDLPVIVLSRSGAESPAVEKAMATLGNVSLIERPMRVSTLLSVVRAALRARERQYQVRDHLDERARAEQRLVRDAMLLSKVQDSVVLTDLDGIVTFWNDGATRLFGYTAEETVGRHYADRLPEATRGEIVPWIERIARGEAEFEGEWLDHRKDETRVWIEASTRRVTDATGKPVGIMGVSRDISARKRAESALTDSEKRFRHLAETIPQLAWMADGDGAIFWFNRRWYDHTGTTVEQMHRGGWQSVHDSAHLPGVTAAWEHSVRTGEPFEMEFPLKGADGRFRWFLTRAAPLRDEHGKIVFWFGTNTDVEDRRRIAEERAELLEAERSARVEAERAGRMKDEFLATLSHELRTPLNAILGWVQLLRATPTTAQDLAEGLDTIERNARAQTQIIEDLLDMSRIISGKVRLDVTPLDLIAVVDFAVQTVQPAARAKDIRLECTIETRDAQVSGDSNRLQQVFWNLLSNAVKFTPAGGRIGVAVRRVDEHVQVVVADSGEGIAPEFLPHVFDRFRQADATTTRRHGGLGLGLAIVKQLVELHGGTITARSQGARAGSSFTVTIPVAALNHESEPRHEPRRRASGFRNAIDERFCDRLAGMKVLVVDDEPDSRAVVQRLLEACGVVVVASGSAAEAMERMTSERPDLLVSDIGMPGEDGCSLVRRIRALGPIDGGDIPALALTAYARTEDRTRSMQAGFQAHLVKPVEPSELIATVAGLAEFVKARPDLRPNR